MLPLAIGALFLGGGLGQAATAPANTVQPVNHARLCEPLVKPMFLPLPPGAVEPAGWLRDWALAARNGITGHLDGDHLVFGEAWKGIPINAPNAASDGTGWPLEQCAYWLDGAIRLGLVLHDEALIRKIRARLDPVVDGVNKADFGTSLIYWKKGSKPEGFNSWAHSQMGRALVALYQGTGDKRVLDALVALKVPVQAFDWKPTDAQALPGKPVTGTASETVRLVPYGCTRFRVSMFPVTDRAWAAPAKALTEQEAKAKGLK